MRVEEIPFSEDEANALLQIIDAAVRGTGLQHAANGAFLAAKIRNAFAPVDAPANDETTADAA